MELNLGGGLILLLVGFFLFSGYLAHLAADKTSIPGVTILIILGVLLNPSVSNIIPKEVSSWFPFISHIALAMIGFLLGESFNLEKIQEKGSKVIVISIGETVLAILVVLGALLLVGAPLPMAIVLAGIAPASAPAALFETIKESHSKGELTDTVLGVVAIDDAWGVLAFSVCFMIAQIFTGDTSGYDQLYKGIWEITGAVLLGAIIGFPMAWITKRIREGETTLVEAMGFVFVCSGLAIVLHVSYLLACMFMGAVVSNVARKRQRPFHEIDNIREPFLAIFFILAGFDLDLHALTTLGLLGGAYVVARAAGLIAGGYLTGKMLRAPAKVTSHIGWCLLPQAGVALGFALLVKERMPEIGDNVLNLIIATTVIFEIVGPLIAKWHLKKVGETR